MEETSLSDFGGGDEREPAADATDPSATADEAESDEFDTADGIVGDARGASAAEAGPARPTVTAAWAPGGTTCERCGESAGWLWADGDGRVCHSCKDW